MYIKARYVDADTKTTHMRGWTLVVFVGLAVIPQPAPALSPADIQGDTVFYADKSIASVSWQTSAVGVPWKLYTQSRHSTQWFEVFDSRGDTARTRVPLSINPGQCELCAAGTATSLPGSVSCTQCPPGTFAQGPGSTACTPCPSGEHAAKGATSCLDLDTFLQRSGCTCVNPNH